MIIGGDVGKGALPLDGAPDDSEGWDSGSWPATVIGPVPMVGTGGRGEQGRQKHRQEPKHPCGLKAGKKQNKTKQNKTKQQKTKSLLIN